MGDHRSLHAAVGEDGAASESTLREIVNGILCVLQAGCARRMLSEDFPPMMAAHGWCLRFRRESLFETIDRPRHCGSRADRPRRL
jgi:transposase